MLTLHGPEGLLAPADTGSGAALPAGAVWIDLNDPSAEEARAVEAATGIRVPSRTALSEVESSSRLRRLKNGLSLSTPMITFERADSQLKPLGFVLTPDHLVTVRFHELRAFEAAHKRLAEGERAVSSTETFLLIVEELVDGLADALEVQPAQRTTFVRLARTPLAPSPADLYDHAVTAPLPIVATRRAALPAAPTPLIGREAERADLARRLRDPAAPDPQQFDFTV